MKTIRLYPIYAIILAGAVVGLWRRSFLAGLAVYAVLFALYAIKASRRVAHASPFPCRMSGASRRRWAVLSREPREERSFAASGMTTGARCVWRGSGGRAKAAT